MLTKEEVSYILGTSSFFNINIMTPITSGYDGDDLSTYELETLEGILEE